MSLSDDNKPALQKLNHRWFQISLRNFFILFTIAILVTAIWIVPAERQHNALKQIAASGHSWLYNGEEDPPYPANFAYTFWSKHHSEYNRFESYTRKVTQVYIFVDPDEVYPTISWSGLPHLKNLVLHYNFGDGRTNLLKELLPLQKLETFQLAGGKWTNDEVALIAELRSLVSLSISPTHEISSEGIAHLSKLPCLKQLHLHNYVNDPDLKHFSELRGLGRLKLNSAEISSTGMASIAKLKHLQHLDLNFSKIEAGTTHYLGQLEELRSLDLSQSYVPKTDFEFLSKLERLEELNLYMASIDDNSIEHLLKLRQLRILDLESSGITEDAIKRLSELPNLEHLSVGSYCPTERSLEHLPKYKKLKEFASRCFSISDEKIAEFKRNHPHIEINRGVFSKK